MKFGTDNPLNEFISYTVRYRLFCTTRFEDAIKLVQNINSERFLNKLVLYNTSEQTFIRDKIIDKDKGFVYYDIVDSARDVDLFVTKYDLTSFLNISPNDTRGYGEAIQMQIDIHEAYSGNFIGWLSRLLDEADSEQLFFVIKPIFTGLINDGETFTEKTYKDNPANIMILTELLADFSTQGSNYTLKGVCNIGGIGNLPSKHLNIIDQLSVNIPPNSSFETFFEQTLVQKLNNIVETRHLKDSGTKTFSRYQYKIVLDNEYKTAEYKFDNITTIATKTGKKDPTLSFRDCNVYDMLFKLLTCSNQILTNAQKTDDYKIINNKKVLKYSRPYITSEMVEVKNNVKVITFKINKQYFFKTNDSLSLINSIEDIKTIESMFDVADIRPEILIYQYLFTGKNVDVLDYRMAISRGIVATLVNESNNLLTSNTQVNGNLLNTVNTDQILNKQAEQTALKNQQQATINQNNSLTSGFYDVINRASFMEVIQNKLTVTGNPILFGSLAEGYENRDLKNKPLLFVREKIPAMIFVDVQYPTSPEFWTYETNYTQKPLLDSFWYRGIQQILKIQSVFEGNNFYHIIDTYPLMTDSQQAGDVLQELSNQVAEELKLQSTATSAVEKVKNEQEKINAVQTATIKNASSSKSAQSMHQRLPAAVANFKLNPQAPVSQITVTSSYGVPRKRKKLIKGKYVTVQGYHYGTDLYAGAGTAVKSGIAGTITCFATSTDLAAGYGIDIVGSNGITIRYFHIKPLAKFLGKNRVTTVTDTDVIGTVANFPANSTSKPHIHIELFYEGKLYNSLQVLNNPNFKNDADVINIQF